MTSKYTNKNGVKLLAAVMALAIAFAGIVVVIDNSSDATSDPITLDIAGEVSGFDTSGETNGFDGSSLKITNAGLGNVIFS